MIQQFALAAAHHAAAQAIDAMVNTPSEWKPTMNLRFIRNHKARHILQQQWERTMARQVEGGEGFSIETETEWRDVAIGEEDDE